MNRKIIFKMIIDLSMTIFLLLLMSYQATGEKNHEWLGAGMGLLFIIHIILNRLWYKNLFKGKYTNFRIIQTIINFLILFLMIGSLISGIAMSRYVFKSIDLNIGNSFARLVHMVTVYWGFILMSVHLGMHLGMINGLFNKLRNKKILILLKSIFYFISLYGVYTFIKLNLFSYMILKNQFVFFDFEQTFISVLFDYFSVMTACAVGTHYFIKILRRKKGGR